MKFSTIILLPLAVSGAVVRPRSEQGTATLNEVTQGAWMTGVLDERDLLTKSSVSSAPPAATTSAASGGGWLPTLGQIGDLLNSAYTTFNGWTQNYNDISAKAQGALPDLLYAGTNAMSWFMSWASKPVKVEKVAPVIDQSALKKIIRYGPFILLGSKVSTYLPKWTRSC
jgi:hypothetical protein